MNVCNLFNAIFCTTQIYNPVDAIQVLFVFHTDQGQKKAPVEWAGAWYEQASYWAT